MNTILEKTISESVINHSRFIAVLMPLKSKDDVKNIIQDLQKEYPKATHYCYGYNVNGIAKSSDDGEPSGTAGRPILEVLLKKEITNAILVVIRYFGGIKLGAGGLLRAYVDGASSVIGKANLYHYEERQIIEITVSYSLNDLFNNYLNTNKYDIVEIFYDEEVTYQLSLKDFNEDEVKDFLQGKCKISYLEVKTILVKNEV